MNTDELLAEFDALRREVAPELSANPFYTFMQPPELCEPFGTVAYNVRGRHFGVREFLRSIDRWAGWGPTIIFIDEPSDRLAFLALAIHELAHVFPVVDLGEDFEPTEAQVAAQDLLVLSLSGDPRPCSQSVPWHNHDAAWIRRVIHLWHRGHAAGVPLRFNDIHAAGNRYKLSPFAHYIVALGSEPFAMRRRTFAEIESEPAPAAFTALWDADVAHWNQQQRKAP